MSKLNRMVSMLGVGAFALPFALNAIESPIAFSGFYAGLDAGGAWGSSSYQTDPRCPPVIVDAVFCNAAPDPSISNGAVVADSGSGKLKPQGFNLNAHLGYNWLIDNFILGGEADFGLLNLNKSTSVSGLFPLVFAGDRYVLTESISTDWVATLRARAGAALLPQLLAYAMGGLALTDLKIASTYNDNAVGGGLPGGSGSGTKSHVKSGWTLGLGAEWQLSDCYSIKAEYLYMNFGSVNTLVPLTNTSAFTQTMEYSADLKTNIVRLGFNYWL